MNVLSFNEAGHYFTSTYYLLYILPKMCTLITLISTPPAKTDPELSILILNIALPDLCLLWIGLVDFSFSDLLFGI